MNYLEGKKLRMKKIKYLLITSIITIAFLLTGCNEAENVEWNIQQASDSFETYREVTFINLRTDKVLLQIEGYISIKNSAEDELAVIIQTAPREYQMHYLYIGGEVVYLVQQKENTTTSPYNWDIRIFAEFPNIIIE